MNRANVPASLANTLFGIEALEFQRDLDAVLRKHGAILVMENAFDTLRLQARFDRHHNAALTLIHVTRKHKRGTFGYVPEPAPAPWEGRRG